MSNSNAASGRAGVLTAATEVQNYPCLGSTDHSCNSQQMQACSSECPSLCPPLFFFPTGDNPLFQMAKWDMVEASCTDLFPSQEQTFLVVPTMPDLDSDPVYPTKEGGSKICPDV